MSIEIDEVNSDPLFTLADWALDTGIWNGIHVSKEDTSQLQDELAERILQYLFSHDPESFEFQKMMTQLATLGSNRKNPLLEKEIQALRFTQDGMILQAGFGRSIKKFWKKHKTEILIGAAVVAVVTTVAVVAVCSGGTASGAAASTGAAALDALRKKEPSPPSPTSFRLDPPKIEAAPIPERPTKPMDPFVGIEPQKPVRHPQTLKRSEWIPNFETFPRDRRIEPLPEIEIPLKPYEPSYDWLMEQQKIQQIIEERPQSFDPPQLQKIPLQRKIEEPVKEENKSWVMRTLESMGREIVDNPDLFDPDAPLPSQEFSSIFSIEGEKPTWLGFGGTNGMNTTMEEARAHAKHLAKFAKGHHLDWVYNRTHGPVADVLEILTLNLPGCSPNTSDLLLESWKAFHEANANDPDVKFLQFCHSQGTIHVRNALLKAPPEIQNRVKVMAFGPAVIISDETCYDVQHYACEGDLIPNGEVAFETFTKGAIKGASVAKAHEKIIWVKRHPDTKSPHDFQNPAFDVIKMNTIEDHIKRKGKYL